MAKGQQPHAPCNDNLMFLVQHVIYGAPLCSVVQNLSCEAALDCLVISTKNNSFKVLQDDDDHLPFPNLSRLKADNYNPVLKNASYEVLATCDSWMLLTCTKHDEYTWDVLWDPTADEMKSLPYFSLASPGLTYMWAYGFGFDPSGGGYKVVRCRARDADDDDVTHEEKIYVELLSLASGSWKEIPYPYDPYYNPVQLPSLHINGVYYWQAMPTGIISFDFAKEEFIPALIPMPTSDERLLKEKGEYILAEIDGSLAVIISKDGEFASESNSIAIAAETKPFMFELWVWKAPKWSRVSSRNVPAADHAHCVLGLYNNYKLLLWSSDGDLLLYDIVSTELKKLGIHVDLLGLDVTPYVANGDSKLKSSMINLPSGASNVVASAIQRPLSRNYNNNNLMLMVQCLHKWTRNYFVLSTENNKFKVLQDENSLPNLSLLKAQNYDPVCLYAKYHVLASCSTWMLWMCTQYPGSPMELLWDPRTDVLVTLPFFEAAPRVPCPIITSMWGYGIGFVSGEYKVVRCRVFNHFRCENEAHAELFSLETCSWKQIPFPHDPQLESMQHPSLHIHVNGFYYWLAVDPTEKDQDLFVISFDFANEEFPRDLIRMPEREIVPRLDCVTLAEFRGFLAAIVYDYHVQKKKSTKRRKKTSKAPFRFEIWVWINGTWSYESKHRVTPPRHANAGVVYRRVVGLYKDHKAFLQDSEGYLWLYDLVSDELERTGICDDGFGLAVYPYV